MDPAHDDEMCPIKLTVLNDPETLSDAKQYEIIRKAVVESVECQGYMKLLFSELNVKE